MKILKTVYYITIILFFVFAPSFAEITSRNVIKVGILLNVAQVNIASDKKYTIKVNDKKLYLSAGKINIRMHDKNIVINDKYYSLPIIIESSSFIAVNKTFYRGNIIINLSSNNNLNVINEITVEDYLKGILAKEASSSWNIEVLKVQAIISRSYVLKNLSRHSKDGFDVCSTVHCQVYGGASAENKKCNEAVVQTDSEVVVYDNEIAQTVFHDSCGGWTEDPKYVWQWNKTPAYLKGRKDKYCKNSPRQNWSCTISKQTIKDKLTKAGYKTGTIKNIKASGNTPGHAKEKIIIKHSDGTLTLNSYKFRLAVDSWLIKSTMINSIKKQNENFVFKGKGWGHKVGLCQWGAKEMADKGFSYKKILEFYYPDTKIGKVKYDK